MEWGSLRFSVQIHIYVINFNKYVIIHVKKIISSFLIQIHSVMTKLHKIPFFGKRNGSFSISCKNIFFLSKLPFFCFCNFCFLLLWQTSQPGLLVDCAKPFENGHLEHDLLKQIWNFVDNESNKIQSKVAKYFVEALICQAYLVHPAHDYFTLHFFFLFKLDCKISWFRTRSLANKIAESGDSSTIRYYVIMIENNIFLKFKYGNWLYCLTRC